MGQSEKDPRNWPTKQSASLSKGCQDGARTRRSFDELARECPGLDITVDKDNMYEGALMHWTRWAFNESSLLCRAGFTTLGADGNPFTGSSCPTTGGSHQANVSKKVQGAPPGPVSQRQVPGNSPGLSETRRFSTGLLTEKCALHRP